MHEPVLLCFFQLKTSMQLQNSHVTWHNAVIQHPFVLAKYQFSDSGTPGNACINASAIGHA